jgi:predicted DNA-binding protein
MGSRRECEFLLVRYVPDPVRNEFVHVGVILREVSGPVAAVKFTSDWRRVRCLDPEADTAMLEGLESELRRRFEQEPEGNLMHVLEDSFSNSVQVTRAKAYLAESIEAGVEELMRLYVEPQKRERVSRLSGRATIQAEMRSEFERAGVWDLLRKRIAASQYTRPGDPLRIDLGYRPNGVIRMFQAVSLEAVSGFGSGLETAKALAFSMPGLVAGVERVEKASLELTAVVEPLRQGSVVSGQSSVKRQGQVGQEDIELDVERVAAYRFAVETMEEHRIRVLTTADLARVADTARRELRV